MLVTLIGKKSIYKITLPQFAVGNYWISDKSNEKEKKLVNIEARDGKWQVVSNNHAKIINPRCINIMDNKIRVVQTNECVVDRIALRDYGMHCIAIGNYDDIYILYCSPVYETNFLHLDVRYLTEITIGKSSKCDIIYDNILVRDLHAKIVFNNGRWIIENYDTKLGTFVNGTPVFKNTRVLRNGDIIFILGLRIVIMGNSIFINNPNNKMKYNPQNFNINTTKNTTPTKETLEEDNEEELNIEEKYYSRAPRIRNKIEHETVKIDSPPQAQNKDEMPALLVIGSTLSMGIVMMISMGNSITGIANGNASAGEIILSVFMTFAMLISMILFPILEMKYSKKQKAKYEEKRQNRYKEYINSKIKEVDEIMFKQRNILSENYVSVEECSNIILSRSPRLWERKIEDFDFLTCRLGIGDVPLDADIQYPEKTFAMEDDNLVEILNTIANKSKILNRAPITVSLAEKNITGIISNDYEEQKNFVKNLILQLITFHSYEDLKLVFLLKKDNEKKWEHLKMLPHVWDNAHQIRFFADDYDDMTEISSYLEEDLRNRYSNQEVDYKSFSPYYLIISDDYKKIANLKIITEILSMKQNVGFSILCMADNLMQLPNECKTFIKIDSGKGSVFESEMLQKDERTFNFDDTQKIFFEKISQTIANIPIKYSLSKENLLPSVYTFLEMYDVGLIEQLNILERWKRNNPTISLRAPIGIDSSGMRIALDIHEKFHGPHGLIAGSTRFWKK